MHQPAVQRIVHARGAGGHGHRCAQDLPHQRVIITVGRRIGGGRRQARRLRIESLDQHLGTTAPHRHRFDHRHAERLLQRRQVDDNAAPLCGIHHVQRHDHRSAELAQLQRKAQMQAQIGRVHHIDQHIRRRLARIKATAQVAGDGLVQARRLQAVGAGQIQHRKVAPRRCAEVPFLTLDGDAGVVGHFLPATGELVEQCGLAAVGVANQRQTQRNAGRAHADPPAWRTCTRAASLRRRAKRV